MFELVEFDIPELLNVYLKFENEEVSPVGVLKRGGLKRVANGDLRKTSSLTVNSTIEKRYIPIQNCVAKKAKSRMQIILPHYNIIITSINSQIVFNENTTVK